MPNTIALHQQDAPPSACSTPDSGPAPTESGWQATLADLVTDPNELLSLLDLEAEAPGLGVQGLHDFPLRVPRPFLARMRRGDPDDPLLRQVLPLAAEDLAVSGYGEDPLQEERYNPRPGLLHKYRGRALLLVTSSCAIHCRYCFRRDFPYEDNNPGRKQWERAFAYLAEDESIEEVIFSGGDPLAAPDRHLAWLCERLAAIPHLRRLRLHTRLPVMIPSRVDEALCRWLSATRLRTVVVIHSNHAREFDAGVDAACARLRQAGALLLNQSVLLAGVNDSAAALARLSTRMLEAGVLPYYLHLLDRTRGTAHFEVSGERALALLEEVRAMLPGYLVPSLVREVPGEASKTPLLP